MRWSAPSTGTEVIFSTMQMDVIIHNVASSKLMQTATTLHETKYLTIRIDVVFLSKACHVYS